MVNNYSPYMHSLLLDGCGTALCQNTEKNADMWMNIIRRFTREADLVVNLNSGPMTDAIACVLSARRYLGFEHDERLFRSESSRMIV